MQNKQFDTAYTAENNVSDYYAVIISEYLKHSKTLIMKRKKHQIRFQIQYLLKH